MMRSLTFLTSLALAVYFYFGLFGDVQPVSVIRGGEVCQNHDSLTVFLDGEKVRDCPGIIQNWITTCRRLELPSTKSMPTPGTIAPFSFPLPDSIKKLGPGHLCGFIAQGEFYCNSVQALLRRPIVVRTPEILWVTESRESCDNHLEYH